MRKILSALLVLMLLVPAAFAVAEDAPYEINILMPTFYAETFQAENNPVLQAMEAATNTKLTITFVPDATYPEAISTALMDADTMPQLIIFKGVQDPIVVDSARAGAFWDLTDYIADTEYLKDGSEVVYNNIKIDGRLYGIYRSRPLARNGIIYRKDWAEELGLGAPETLEDLANMAKAFTNAEKNTYGLVMCKYVDGTIKEATIMHGAPNTWGINEAGDIYPAHEDTKFRDGLNWLRDLYAAGAINQDFIALESTIWDDPIKNSQGGIKMDVMDGGPRLQDYFTKELGEENTIFNLIPYVKNAEGEARMWPTAGQAGMVTITKSAKTEEDMLKCLKFLDFLNSAEGQTLVNWGVADVTYGIDEEGFRFTLPQEQTPVVNSIQNSINQLGMAVNGALDLPMKNDELRTLYNQILIDNMDKVIGDPCAAFISETNTMYGATLKTLLEDAHVQYIAGEIDEAGLEAVYQQWRANGGEQVISEMNEMYKAAH